VDFPDLKLIIYHLGNPWIRNYARSWPLASSHDEGGDDRDQQKNKRGVLGEIPASQGP